MADEFKEDGVHIFDVGLNVLNQELHRKREQLKHLVQQFEVLSVKHCHNLWQDRVEEVSVYVLTEILHQGDQKVENGALGNAEVISGEVPQKFLHYLLPIHDHQGIREAHMFHILVNASELEGPVMELLGPHELNKVRITQVVLIIQKVFGIRGHVESLFFGQKIVEFVVLIVQRGV